MVWGAALAAGSTAAAGAATGASIGGACATTVAGWLGITMAGTATVVTAPVWAIPVAVTGGVAVVGGGVYALGRHFKWWSKKSDDQKDADVKALR